MSEVLEIGELKFEVRRSPRRNTYGITVSRGSQLIVHAPINASENEVEGWARKKLLWVYRKLAWKRQSALTARSPDYVSGESFSYLGRRYPLRVTLNQHVPLRFDGRRFLLRAASRPGTDHFRRWYIRTGAEWIRNRVNGLTNKTGTEPSRVDVRDLGFNWGSCGKSGTLYFNWRILQIPVRLVDYVIVHELVHLREPSHGRSFRSAIERALPDWREREETLRTTAKEFLMFDLSVERLMKS